MVIQYKHILYLLQPLVVLATASTTQLTNSSNPPLLQPRVEPLASPRTVYVTLHFDLAQIADVVTSDGLDRLPGASASIRFKSWVTPDLVVEPTMEVTIRQWHGIIPEASAELQPRTFMATTGFDDALFSWSPEGDLSAEFEVGKSALRNDAVMGRIVHLGTQTNYRAPLPVPWGTFVTEYMLLNQPVLIESTIHKENLALVLRKMDQGAAAYAQTGKIYDNLWPVVRTRDFDMQNREVVERAWKLEDLSYPWLEPPEAEAVFSRNDGVPVEAEQNAAYRQTALAKEAPFYFTRHPFDASVQSRLDLVKAGCPLYK